ncbi:uncharacterized protein TNCT_271901 [Trichonephila clavata]|uniref:Uncharacterized protein n=1 Tax=Trichonephila clavata TaxID=2740835 RepID=A0A8X6KI74_TRICU|nr:uncharacterized protein TNCT_271901 [Trichonephila clavata]
MSDLNRKIAELFTVTSHYSRISVVLILQNLFPRNKEVEFSDNVSQKGSGERGVKDIESQRVNLLHESKYSDDAKAKLLYISQLLLKYQRAINEPKPPLRVTIEDSKEQVQEESKKNTIEDPILRDIILSVPANFQKFIPPIVEKLNTRSYDWNKYGELTKDSEIVKNTNVIDLFSYLMRNVKKGHEPYAVFFWRGIKEIKIPTRWIGNQKLGEILGDDTILDEVQKEYTFETSERVTLRIGKKRKQNLTKRKWKEF